MILFDVNNFGPFNAEVWGTTSDWFMFAVTGITAIYLIKTFRSQKEVQRLQQEVTSIEIARHKSEIMPIFKVELADSCFVKEKAGVLSIQADFRVKLERSNVANDLKLILNFKNQDKWAVNPECKLLFNQFLPSYTTYVECFYESKVKPTEDMVRFNTAFDLNIEYADVNGNYYRQHVAYASINTEHQVVVNYPIEIPSKRI